MTLQQIRKTKKSNMTESQVLKIFQSKFLRERAGAVMELVMDSTKASNGGKSVLQLVYLQTAEMKTSILKNPEVSLIDSTYHVKQFS